ncbi:FkbM family methyltransferase [Candidatus Pelagibacter sp. FZCC0015]|uniref:FkbM family methyltransferase n=1 Tax=Candidatus Pelagibacter sp. FZCC0015 TaxID=2268451 RepID=UPI0011A3F5B3|nr:FkbM family methyltransferase [Candidatus Pelagibacter sp. FZCC0015]|tara:strand:- start:219 stop:977 length:759 start_codon:yes stop_codon:yes gene_type:complete
MKKIVKKIINNLGYDIKKLDKEFKNPSLDDLLKEKIDENPMIFDVGGNKGQSVTKFKKIFKKPIIHSFEPIKSEIEIMSEKFKNDQDVKLNNFALGESIGEKNFNITAQTGASSFNKINKNSKWAEVRSKEEKTTVNEFSKLTKVKISTLDKYFNSENINHIDLLKIDTQGYEDKVLEGSIETLSKNKIKAIVTEVVFDNCYEKYFSFSDIEKFLLPNNFRMVGIYLYSNSLFNNLTFFADVFYLNKNYYDI